MKRKPNELALRFEAYRVAAERGDIVGYFLVVHGKDDSYEDDYDCLDMEAMILAVGGAKIRARIDKVHGFATVNLSYKSRERHRVCCAWASPTRPA